MKENRRIKYQYNESAWRHRQLSDEKIQFFCVVTSGTIHDKRCICLKEIPDRDIICLQNYEFQRNQCRECAEDAYIRIGAKDPENCSEYKRYFERTKASPKNVRFLYVENRMRTKLYGNSLKIWYKEDVWIILSLDEQGNVQLKHNNYHRNPDGSRWFTSGFHVQNESCRKCRLKYALDVIAGYDYQDHFKNVSEECMEGNMVACDSACDNLDDNLNIFSKDILKKRVNGKTRHGRGIRLLIEKIKDFICSWKV